MVRFLSIVSVLIAFGLDAPAQSFFTGRWTTNTQIFREGDLVSEKKSVVLTDGIHSRTEFPDGHLEVFLPEKMIRHYIYPDDDTVWIESTDRDYSMAIKTEVLPERVLLGKSCKGIKIFWDGGETEVWFNPEFTVQKQFYELHKTGGIKAVYTLTNGAIPLYLSFNSGIIHQIVEVTSIQPMLIDPAIFIIPDKKVLIQIPGR